MPSRAVRKSTYAARSAVGELGTRHRLEPRVGHLRPAPRRRHRGRGWPAISASTAATPARRRQRRRGRWRPRAGRRTGPGPSRRRPSRGGSTAQAPWSITHRSPCHSSRLGLRQRPVDVGAERVEPEQPRGASSVAAAARPSYPNAPGRKSTPEVEPGAGVEQVLDLLVGLVAGDLGVELERRPAAGCAARAGGPARRRSPRRPAPGRPGRRRGTCRRRCPGRRPRRCRAGCRPRAAA